MYVTYKGVKFPEQKHYEGARFNVISNTRGWVGIKFPEKKRYVKLEQLQITSKAPPVMMTMLI